MALDWASLIDGTMSPGITNTWGILGGLEAQRADLWQVDLSQPLDYLRSMPDGLVPGFSKSVLPNGPEFMAYAQRISLPAAQVTLWKQTVGTVPRQMPHYQQELEQIRLELIHDTPDDFKQSSVYTALAAWLALGRLGRDGGLAAGKLPHAGYRPNFRHDVPIRLLVGTADGTALQPYSQLILRRAWLAGLQLSELDAQTGNSFHTVTAVLYAAGIEHELLAGGLTDKQSPPDLDVLAGSLVGRQLLVDDLAEESLRANRLLERSLAAP